MARFYLTSTVQKPKTNGSQNFPGCNEQLLTGLNLKARFPDLESFSDTSITPPRPPPDAASDCQEVTKLERAGGNIINPHGGGSGLPS